MRREAFHQDWQFGESGKEKRKVTLPHDATQEQGRSADAPAGNRSGYFLGGRYEYEKRFFAAEEWRGKTAILEFEGVYPSARVSVNGKLVRTCKYGYNCFQVPLEGLAYGAENVITVELDNSGQPNSRWYAGAGIYRPVWLLTGERESILPEDIRVTTLSAEPARILVEVQVHSFNAEQNTAKVYIAVFDGEKEVARAWGTRAELEIPQGKLWSAQEPNLYRCEVCLYREGECIDRESVSFGIRTLEWSAAEGLKVNGTSVLLKGGCIHHDNGILGARSFETSEYRRIRRLKEFGFNAIRSAHNPLCKAALRACDQLGMYVMDELWDGWDKPKAEFDYGNDFAEHYQEDILAQVKKDYNHPSVILYSIGNEMTEPAKPEGVELGRKIVEEVHRLDGTRPVTAGVNLTLLLMATMEHNPLEAGAGGAPATEKMDSTAYNRMVTEMGSRMTLAAATEPADRAASPILDLLDIAGYNYAVSRYEKEGELHPERIVVGSETYPYDILKTWKLVERYPYLIGDFMWAAWDYLGEAGIGGWSYEPEDMGFEKRYPWLLADTGAFDILGNHNAEAGMAAVAWGARKEPYIGVCPVNHPGVTPTHAIWRGSNALPHWSYRGCEGNEAWVEVYSLADSVELFVNGVSRGRQSLEDGKVVFRTVYESGECRAVAYDKEGSQVGESSLHSAEGKIGIRILGELEAEPPKGVSFGSSAEANPEPPKGVSFGSSAEANLEAPKGVSFGSSVEANPEPPKGVKFGPPAESENRNWDGILYLDIALTGENGEIECNADQWLEISVIGGELLAFGSARPKTEEGYLSGGCTTYYGRCQAVVRVLEEQVAVKVQGKGLEDCEETFCFPASLLAGCRKA